MLTVQNEKLCLRVGEDGSSVAVIDRRRGCEWRLDNSRRTYRRYESDAAPQRLPDGTAEKSDAAIAISHLLDEGTIRYVWALRDDHVEVSLEAEVDGIEYVALPGPLVPANGPWEIAVPVMQGLLIRAKGSSWERTFAHRGHDGFSMAMGAVIAPGGTLLVTHECPSNWMGTFGEAADDGLFLYFQHRHCPVDGWADAAVRLYPVDPEIVAICKQYRRCVKERGEFVSWSEKIAAKPMLKELFGALIAFVGYNKTPEIDYVDSARTLKSYGFDSIFYYSTRMCQYSLNFKMGGDDPIWLTDEEIDGMRAVEGSHLAPWGWVFEGLDDGTESMRRIFCQGPDGPVPNWKIDDYQWYQVCTPYQVEHIKQRFATDMGAMDWIHFDVNAMRSGACCLSTEHDLHGNRPMSRREDMAWTRKLLSVETVGNRVVSSEGFGDHYAPYYDIGTTKCIPLWDENSTCAPVPMTMLVFHDSCVHDWWELHNYNASGGGGLREQPEGLVLVGSGHPRLKAAIDALYGSPPNLFPFGKQYTWVDRRTRRTRSFVVHLEDPEVQEAIRAALPVGKLHKKIGMCEMVSFEFLSEDRTVQGTTFSDGTRIVANLSDTDKEVDGYGTVPAQSWKKVKA